MEKIFKICCPCICVCLCVIVVSIIGISVYFLKQYFDRCQLLIGASLLIIMIMCICVLCNNWRIIKILRSKSEDIESKLKNIEGGYKDLSKKMSRCSFCSTSIANDSIYKTIEKIAETFCNKNCDDTKLKTLKEVIDAIIKSYESNGTLSNGEQSQEKENNGTESNEERIIKQ